MAKLKMSQIQMLNEFLSIKEEANKLFSSISDEQFNKKPNEDSWSAAECIAHLNLIAHGYTKYFPVELNTRKELPNLSDKQYQTRILAGIFISKMMPESKLKLHTPSEYQAAESELPKSIVVDFQTIQDQFIHLLKRTEFIELKARSVRSPVASFLKFQLGELFILHIGHQKRHLNQAKNAIKF
ncbi:MAG: DinB family protein [Melioribacteraceae bacterium]|jgi:hypothetical protein|nr:DinB family protein [Melioribacteraceae bacterium]